MCSLRNLLADVPHADSLAEAVPGDIRPQRDEQHVRAELHHPLADLAQEHPHAALVCLRSRARAAGSAAITCAMVLSLITSMRSAQTGSRKAACKETPSVLARCTTRSASEKAG